MARGGTSPVIIVLSPAERAPLAHWQGSTTIKAGLAKGGPIIPLRADGLALAEIARRLAMGRRLVRHWRKRFLHQRSAGLSDKPGRGRPPLFSPRGRGTSGQDGLRATGSALAFPLPVGWPRTGPATRTRGDGRRPLRRDGPPSPGVPSAAALAPPPMAVADHPAGHGVRSAYGGQRGPVPAAPATRRPCAVRG
jgi:Helix-turn-helix domain